MKEKIIKGFKKDVGFIHNNNFVLEHLSEEECIISYEVKKEGTNSLKIVHGGLLFGLADTCAGTLACMSGKFPVTLNASINYLNPAKCKKLIAKAITLKIGNNTGCYRVDILNENEEMICTSNITMHFKN